MSGGSWDYFTFEAGEVADKLRKDKDPLRRAFGEHMQLVADAMYAIEWADSGDTEGGSEVILIERVLGVNVTAKPDLESKKQEWANSLFEK